MCLVNCPKCRGEGFLASGSLGVRPVAAFDIAPTVFRGETVDGCWVCGGAGRVPEYVVPRLEMAERERNSELAEVLRGSF